MDVDPKLDPASALAELRRINTPLREKLAARYRAVDEREAKARRELAACADERAAIDADAEPLEQLEQAFKRAWGISDNMVPSRAPVLSQAPAVLSPVAADGRERRRRNRIGPQRYRMLHLLRAEDSWLSLQEIADSTELSVKRVRDQMRTDTRDGFVAEREEYFQITPSGLALLDLFEASRRSHGEALPSLDGPIGEDDPEDSEPYDVPETFDERYAAE